MCDTVIKIENLSKQYRLGLVGTGTLSHDLNRMWARMRGKADPTLAVTEDNDRSHKGHSEYVWALKDVNLEVNRGDVLGIIGRNGAGKSTLLKILSRITAPTSGSVKVKGRIASLLEVGTGFHQELTGRENIYLNGAILGMPRAEVAGKLDEIVAFSGSERFLDTPVKRYSSGMIVRLGFAVAAHLEPDILVVDEVLAVGDVEFQKKCIGKMQDVAGHGRTVLFVSHNMASVEALCSRALILRDGRLAQTGDVSTIIRDYLSAQGTVGDGTPDQLSTVLHKVTMLDNDGNAVNAVPVGGDIRFRIDMDLKEREVKSPKIGIGINDNLGQRIVTVANFYSTSELPPLAGRQSIICQVENQNLAPGTYHLKVSLGDGIDDFDSVEHALAFQIEATDFFANGRLPTRGQGKVVMKSTWELIK